MLLTTTSIMHLFSRKRRWTTTTFVPLLLLSVTVQTGLTSALTNITVDDQTGDELTGIVPTYTPLDSSNGDWAQGTTCSVCLVKPDASKAFEGTWHDATHEVGDLDQRTIEINFNGTAVYAFLICANTVSGATTLTNLTFSLDGSQVGTFVHVPKPTTDYEYNVPGYVNTSLPDGNHQLLIQTTGDDNASLILFDYLIYSNSATSSDTTTSTETATSNTPSSTTSDSQSKGAVSHKKTGAIVGAVVGIAAVAAITIMSFICWKRKGRGRVYFGKQSRDNITLDEDNGDYTMQNAAAPLPFTLNHNDSFSPVQSNMAESQYPTPSSAHASSTFLTTTAVNSSSLAVQNPDDAGRSDSAASAVSGGGAAMLKAKERQTEIVRQVEEMQQRVALLRSQSNAGGSSSQRENSATGSGIMSDGEAEMRDQIAALQAEVERLQYQQVYFQQRGWGVEPPPQYAEGSIAQHI